MGWHQPRSVLEPLCFLCLFSSNFNPMLSLQLSLLPAFLSLVSAQSQTFGCCVLPLLSPFLLFQCQAMGMCACLGDVGLAKLPALLRFPYFFTLEKDLCSRFRLLYMSSSFVQHLPPVSVLRNQDWFWVPRGSVALWGVQLWGRGILCTAFLLPALVLPCC